MDERINHRGHRGKNNKGRLRLFGRGTLLISLSLFGFLCALCGSNNHAQPQTSDLALPLEKHLRNIKQLTFGGENAEAYFSADGRKLIFQSTRAGHDCDQIYTMNIDGSYVKMVSNGDGRTTCSYFFPNGKRILYSSPHLGGRQSPQRLDFF